MVEKVQNVKANAKTTTKQEPFSLSQYMHAKSASRDGSAESVKSFGSQSSGNETKRISFKVPIGAIK